MTIVTKTIQRSSRFELITECGICGKVYKTEAGMLFHLCRKHKAIVITGHNAIDGRERAEWIATEEDIAHRAKYYHDATREEAKAFGDMVNSKESIK